MSTSGADNKNISAQKPIMPARAPGKAIDICHYQRVTDWRKVAQSVDAIILKSTQGHALSSNAYMFEDSAFDAYAKKCVEHHIPFAAYHFFTAESIAAAVREADCMAQALAPYKQYVMYAVCDAEAYGGNRYIMGISRAELTARINAFCSRMASHGYRAAHYTNTDHINSKINLGDISCPAWIASYGAKPKQDMIAWQYTDRGSVPGIVGSVDMNEAYFDGLADIYKLALFGVINTPGYWVDRAERVKFLPTLISRCADRITAGGKRYGSASDGIAALVRSGIIDTPGYWEAHKGDVQYLGDLLAALGACKYR